MREKIGRIIIRLGIFLFRNKDRAVSVVKEVVDLYKDAKREVK